MADKYRIISDGKMTHIYDPDGKEIRNVTSIEIKHDALRPVIAYVKLVLVQPSIDVQCGAENG